MIRINMLALTFTIVSQCSCSNKSEALTVSSNICGSILGIHAKIYVTLRKEANKQLLYLSHLQRRSFLTTNPFTLSKIFSKRLFWNRRRSSLFLERITFARVLCFPKRLISYRPISVSDVRLALRWITYCDL